MKRSPRKVLLKVLLKVVSCLNLLVIIDSIMSVLPTIAAKPKANSSQPAKVNQADKRAADEYRQLGLN